MIDPSYTYLLVNAGSFIIPFIFSFHPKLDFYKTWKAFFPAVIITSIVFISWDIVFTAIGIWSFNERYVLGINVMGIPLEEWLFFFCIPYASVFTYHCFKLFFKFEDLKRVGSLTSIILMVILPIIAVAFIDRLYTSITFLATSLFLLAHYYGLFVYVKLGRFYVIYLILLIPFLITNGILTGSWIEDAVVKYNPAHNLGIRILTIPIEDSVYGLFLILMNVTIYEAILKFTQNKMTT